jgi:hypothetical protein
MPCAGGVASRWQLCQHSRAVSTSPINASTSTDLSVSDPHGSPPPSIRQVINETLICRCARIAPKDVAGAAVAIALLRVGVGAGSGRRLPGLTGVPNPGGASGLAGSVTIPRRAGRLGILCKPLRDTRRWWQRIVVEGVRLLVIQAAKMGSQGSQHAAHCVRVIVGAVTTVIDTIATGTVGVAFELTLKPTLSEQGSAWEAESPGGVHPPRGIWKQFPDDARRGGARGASDGVIALNFRPARIRGQALSQSCWQAGLLPTRLGEVTRDPFLFLLGLLFFDHLLIRLIDAFRYRCGAPAGGDERKLFKGCSRIRDP